jgi:membrane associated rhomboid family serine protease
VEAQTDIQTYLERGKQALAQGQAREAAIAYAHGAQMEPGEPMVHLGLAEANLALGNTEVVRMACRRVQELQPGGGTESKTAQALLDVLDKRYDRAMQNVDAIIEEDPGIAYVHALRSYLMRVQKQDYDANLARARAARLSYGGRFENCFPAIEVQSTPAAARADRPEGVPPATPQGQANREVPTWSRPTGRMQKQLIRTRFALSQYPGIVTNILVAINVIVFILSYLFQNIVLYGAQINGAVLHGEVWRLVTAMFLHNDPLHLAVNMLSLFFVGRAVEVYYGPWRYLLIYFLSGIGGGLLFLFTSPADAAVVGASGAIFGIFGAIGVFYIANRRALGTYAGNAIGQWLMWMVINIVISISSPGIALFGHVGGLVVGMILAYILLPRTRRRRA